jgi:hypothetical protein
MKSLRSASLLAAGFTAASLASASADWPTWGGTNSRNMVSTEKNPPLEFDPGKKIKGKDEVDLTTTKGLKWAARLGSQAYGTLSVANGKILLGTNNENPWDSKYNVKNKDSGKVTAEDRSILLCLDEKSGQMTWQLAAPKLGTGKVSDWEYLGMCSGGAVDSGRVYIATNRCEVLCLDLEGLKNGNDGLQDEAKYLTSPENKIEKTGDTDADIIWRFDMREECGVFPHNVTSSNVLVLEDRIYITTSNGVDWTHTNIPAPEAPSLICLDKKTGKLLGEERSGISKRCLHCSWSSPAFATVGAKPMVVFGAGDGFCYGFDMTFKKDDEGFDIINELWRFDANPKDYRLDDKGAKRAYNTYEGPSEIIATPSSTKTASSPRSVRTPNTAKARAASAASTPPAPATSPAKPSGPTRTSTAPSPPQPSSTTSSTSPTSQASSTPSTPTPVPNSASTTPKATSGAALSSSTAKSTSVTKKANSTSSKPANNSKKSPSSTSQAPSSPPQSSPTAPSTS